MTNKDLIWQFILEHEGGYVNHPSDPGGETKYGITKASYPNLDIKNLTVEDAKEIYYRDYFPKVKGEELLKISPGLALMVADMAFNAGPGRAAKILQQAVNKLAGSKVLTVDGGIGPKTLAEVQGIVDKEGDGNILLAYREVRQQFYEGLKTFSVFGKGWTRRNRAAFELALVL